jgi:hypothetical protein
MANAEGLQELLMRGDVIVVAVGRWASQMSGFGGEAEIFVSIRSITRSGSFLLALW